MKHSPTDGLIYYLLDATRLDQRVKIGYTQALGARLGQLSETTMMRQPPVVLALEEGGTILERERHDQFRDLWLMGEWFTYGDSLAEHLRALPNPIGWLVDRPDLWLYAAGWQSITGWVRQRANWRRPQGDVEPEEVPDFVPAEIPAVVEF